MTTSPHDFQVRFWKIGIYKGKRKTTYKVRWSVGGAVHSQTFATRKLAESFKASLMHAAREGEAFDPESGLPRKAGMVVRQQRLWVELAQEFIDARWDDFAPRHRKSTVDGLVTLTCALVRDDRTPPDARALRKALTGWMFNTGVRQRESVPPDSLRDALAWIESNSLPLVAVGEVDGVRAAMKAVSTNLDGSRASASTVARKRAALSGALNYAVEKGYLPHNPLRDMRMKRRPVAGAIDPRVVVNPDQARDLLRAVHGVEPAVHAYFACLYYAALRPAEARNLRRADLELPEAGWGRIVLHGGYQESGAAWTDDGARGEERHLKHRAETETRVIPTHPELVAALRVHLEKFGTGVDGRLFVTRTGRGGHPLAAPYQNPVSMSTIYRVLAAAREKSLTPDQIVSPLARRPYDLRHAAVSTWLHAGVDSTQVAAWAGHSVGVLMRVYASSLHGREELAMRRIEAALGPDAEKLGRVLDEKSRR
jgi:integrase